MKKTTPIYYDIRDDVKLFPNAWCYIVVSKRGPGKTYSTLRMDIEENRRFAFIKRTKEDVHLLCSGDGKKVDMSPFKPLNRDFGWNIHPDEIEKGIAGFYNYVEFDGKDQQEDLVGYAIASNMAIKVKGMDLSDVDDMIFDEFIPRSWERVSRQEGEAILDLYETINRDRIKRGRPELRLILLANAVEVNNPMTRVLDLVDTMAMMDVNGQEYFYDEYRGIMIHIINSDFDVTEDTQKTGIQRATEGTAWAASSYGAHFAFNDFTAIGREKLKGHKCIMRILYRQHEYYVYRNSNRYYFCKVKGQTDKTYNLNRENQQKLFWEEYGVDLRQAAIEDRVIFSDYTGYDLIVNYKKNFVL